MFVHECAENERVSSSVKVYVSRNVYRLTKQRIGISNPGTFRKQRVIAS